MERPVKTAALILAAAALLGACDSSAILGGSAYTVGGTVSGLTGSDLVLQYVAGGNVAGTATISANGSFAFSSRADNGTAYSVTVKSQPVNPAQVCSVSNGSGTINAADVTSVTVTCGQSGQFAYVANKQSNNISAYTINSSGTLTQITGSPFVSTGNQPDAVLVGPGGNFLYVANSASNDLSVFSINTGTGLLNPVTTVATGVAPYAIAVDPTGSYLYVSNYSSNDVSAYAINASSGALAELSGSPFPVGVAPTSLQIGGRFLYVANYGSGSVSALAIDSGSGALSDVSGSPFSAGRGPISIAINSAGTLAYVANAAGASLSAFSIDATSGALSSVASPLGTQSSPTALAVAGGSLLVADVTQANNIGIYAIGGSGALNLTAMTQTGTTPVEISTSPSGQFAYVVCQGTNNVFLYTLSGGVLTPASPASVSAGTGPVAIAID
jgi:6-phosphogluconolactonase